MKTLLRLLLDLVLRFARTQLRYDLPAIRRGWPLLLFYGAIGFCTFNVLMYVAVHSTSGVNAARCMTRRPP